MIQDTVSSFPSFVFPPVSPSDSHLQSICHFHIVFFYQRPTKKFQEKMSGLETTPLNEKIKSRHYFYHHACIVLPFSGRAHADTPRPEWLCAGLGASRFPNPVPAVFFCLCPPQVRCICLCGYNCAKWRLRIIIVNIACFEHCVPCKQLFSLSRNHDPLSSSPPHLIAAAWWCFSKKNTPCLNR